MQRDKQRDLRKLQDIEEKKAADQAQISKDKVGTVTNSTCTTNTNQVKAMEEGKQQMLQLMQVSVWVGVWAGAVFGAVFGVGVGAEIGVWVGVGVGFNVGAGVRGRGWHLVADI